LCEKKKERDKSPWI
jgi:hypothetical protein